MTLILDSNPQAFTERNLLQQTILHLAVDWPEGLSILLLRNANFLVNEVDGSGQSPLSYAICLRCAETVNLLISAGAYTNEENLEKAFHWGNESITRTVIKAFAETRERLRQSALKNLPQDVFSSLGMPPDHSLNGTIVVDVLKALELCGVEGWDILAMSETSDRDVYSFLFPTVQEANWLYAAGFRLEHCLDSFRSKGTIHFLDKVIWLRQKGINLNDDIALCHDILDWWNKPKVGFLEIWDKEIGRDRSIMAKERDLQDVYVALFTHPGSMSHGCLCSRHGCCPATRHFSTYFSPGDSTSERASKISDPERGGLKAAEAWMGPHHPDWAWIVPKLIRLLTFDMMGLTHSKTCCRRSWYFSKGEIVERQEEEWYLRIRFEEVIDGILAEYNRRGVEFSEFLRNGFQDICESLLKKEDPSEEARWRIKEIGVILDE